MSYRALWYGNFSPFSFVKNGFWGSLPSGEYGGWGERVVATFGIAQNRQILSSPPLSESCWLRKVVTFGLNVIYYYNSNQCYLFYLKATRVLQIGWKNYFTEITTTNVWGLSTKVKDELHHIKNVSSFRRFYFHCRIFVMEYVTKF